MLFRSEYSELNEAFKKALNYCDACDRTADQCICEVHTGDDHVDRDKKLKGIGAKPLSLKDKLKSIPQGFKAMVKGEPEDDVSLYRKSNLEEMKRLAGLK